MIREQLLETAKQTVCHDRNNQYGEPEENFGTVADMWSAYLTRTNARMIEVNKADVANMMVLFKVARNATEPKDDNWVDIAGYAACGAEVQK